MNQIKQQSWNQTAILIIWLMCQAKLKVISIVTVIEKLIKLIKFNWTPSQGWRQSTNWLDNSQKSIPFLDDVFHIHIYYIFIRYAFSLKNPTGYWFRTGYYMLVSFLRLRFHTLPVGSYQSVAHQKKPSAQFNGFISFTLLVLKDPKGGARSRSHYESQPRPFVNKSSHQSMCYCRYNTWYFI